MRNRWGVKVAITSMCFDEVLKPSVLYEVTCGAKQGSVN